ncbi:hypothetical protein OEZ86_002604 [Tetradesmus obliquus]|nr:hypothetical protein OEZ86_002604 [Tetradesmus obliquus]
MLAVAAQLSGGRGRGGRGNSNNLGGGGFSSYTDMVQLQLSSYILATTPAKFRTRRLPKIRDQVSCSTCVAQAVAAATQISIAAALNESVSKWDISARSLYYCSLQGRSCKTGWDIPDALKYILDHTPELVHPSSCLATSDSLLKTESGFTGWRPLCAQALEKAAAGKCKGHLGSKITRAEPWINCTYKSMSSFVEIQEHIRAHGAVISRIIIYDDFQVQFNRSAKLRTSEQLPPYQRNLTARPAFAHAVVLVGYDNDNYTWTAMNSWGKGLSTLISQPGVTADGLFMIQMGIGGVGTPEHTYGITCTATEQRKLATVNTQPWEQERRAVQPVNTSVALNTLAECYKYKVVEGDTVAFVYAGGEQYQPYGLQCGIVDPVPPEWFTTTKDESGNMVAPGRLLIDVDVSNNHLTGNLPDIRAWPHVGSLSLAHNKFSGGVPAVWADNAASSRDFYEIDLGDNRLSGLFPHFLTGSIPASYANMARLKYLNLCNNQQLTGTLPPEFGSAGMMPIDAQFRLGDTGLHGSIPPSWSHFSRGSVGVGGSNISLDCTPDGLMVYQRYTWDRVDRPCSGRRPDVNALVALQRLLNTTGGVSNDLAAWNSSDRGSAGPETPPKFCRLWKGVTCDAAYQITWLNLTQLNIQFPAGAALPLPRVADILQPLAAFLLSLDAASLHLAGTLPSSFAAFYNLQHLDLSGNRGLTGSRPSLWSALTALQTLDVSGTGISGSLPPSWASLQELRAFRAANCSSLSGQLPLEWGILRSLEELVVTNSNLSGTLPAWTDSAAMRAAGNKLSRQLVPGWSLFEQLQVLVLANNSLTGSLPESFARLTTLAVLDVSSNAFSSTLPASWVSLRKLQQLDLSNNTLVSPVPEAWSYLYVGAGSQLRCLALFGNAGLSAAELAALKSTLEQRSTGKTTVVVSGDGPMCPSL